MMKGTNTLNVAAPGPTARAALTSLPQEVLEGIVNNLHGNDKSQLALCCKATLPILCMGHVRVTTKEHEGKKPLLQATRCLAKQPGGVLHLEMSSRDYYAWLDTRRHVNFSLLSNLCKLTLSRVAVSLPALQPVATRLRELNVSGSRLQGSAEGFLTKGWTALTSLALSHTRMDRTILTATLELPALGDAHICWFRGHQDGELELDQLTGGCPQVSRLVFKLAKCWQHFSQASRQRCSLLNLSRLADLQVMSDSLQDIVDLDLPPSLTQLRFQGEECCSGAIFELSWALREAVKCIGQGAQLQKLVCNCEGAFLEPAQWDPSLDEQHTRLGGQLSGLRELEVWCAYEQLLSAVGAVASAAPSLTRLHIVIRRELPRVEVPPICSASLESIRVDWGLSIYRERPPPQVLLTFLPGCTRLQEVVVHFMGGRVKGAAVNIRGHCCNRGYIEPVDGYASFDKSVLEEMYAGVVNGVAVKFRHMPSPELGAEECTILCTCHAAEPGQASLWGHAVMPGIL